jgi:hypothetical protein
MEKGKDFEKTPIFGTFLIDNSLEMQYSNGLENKAEGFFY